VGPVMFVGLVMLAGPVILSPASFPRLIRSKSPRYLRKKRENSRDFSRSPSKLTGCRLNRRPRLLPNSRSQHPSAAALVSSRSSFGKPLHPSRVGLGQPSCIPLGPWNPIYSRLRHYFRRLTGPLLERSIRRIWRHLPLPRFRRSPQWPQIRSSRLLPIFHHFRSRQPSPLRRNRLSRTTTRR
jgi:hypothetical protein